MDDDLVITMAKVKINYKQYLNRKEDVQENRGWKECNQP